jgi:hypothetical protein
MLMTLRALFFAYSSIARVLIRLMSLEFRRFSEPDNIFELAVPR